MSDVSQELIDERKARDARFRAVDLAVEVDAELRDSVALRAVMQQVRDESREAMEEFAVCNPGDAQAVMALQAKVFRLMAMEKTFAFIDAQGRAAAASIQGQDAIEDEYERND